MPLTPPILSLVGRSNTGKTTLMEKLIAELGRRGYRVGTIKHDVHGFELDHPGKDTWRHARAGARAVAISSPGKVALIQLVDHERSIDEVTALMDCVDLVMTEGYKRADKPKIEVTNAESGGELICGPHDRLLAVAAENPALVFAKMGVPPWSADVPAPAPLSVPVFHRDDAVALCDFIEESLLRSATAKRGRDGGPAKGLSLGGGGPQ